MRIDAVSGEHSNQFGRERRRTQRRGDFTDDLLWIRGLFHSERHVHDRQLHPPVLRLLEPVLPLHRGDGDDEQLHQPFHIRSQVPRVPDGRQTCGSTTSSRQASDAWFIYDFQTGVIRLVHPRVPYRRQTSGSSTSSTRGT